MARILVVEDDPQSSYLLITLLQGVGHEARSAGNGAEALALAADWEPDLVISDILMPTMDGFTLLRAWKRHAQLARIPIVIYTATYTEPQDEALAIKLGADRFLIKPEEPELFLQIVDELLARDPAEVRPGSDEPTAEREILQQYNQRLVSKLEDKMKQLEQTNRHLALLLETSVGMAAAQPAEEIVKATIAAVVRSLGIEQANYYRLDPESGELALLVSIGFSEDTITRFRQKLVFQRGEERGVVGLVGAQRKPLIIADTRKDRRWISLEKSVRSAMLVPILHDETLLGVTVFLSPQLNFFDKTTLGSVMAISNTLGLSIRKALLGRKVLHSEARYRSILEGSADAIVMASPDGRITDWNRGASLIFGYPPSAMIGQSLISLIPEGHQGLFAELLTAVRREAPQGEPEARTMSAADRVLEMEIINRQGELVTLFCRLVPSFVEGALQALALIMTDVSEIRAAEHQLRRYSDHLEDLVEERTRALEEAQQELVLKEKMAVIGELAGGVGHELRNPLASISNAIYLLRHYLSDPPEQVRSNLEIIAEELREAEAIISEFQDLTAIGRTQRIDSQVAEIVAAAVEGVIVPAGITLIQQVDPQIDLIKVDPDQVRRVLVNLIDNAVHAMPEGGQIRVGASQREREIIIEVQDTGVGIPGSNLERIFDPLFSTRSKGMGLGLSISKAYLEVNQGMISVQSEEGSGSTFRLIFPKIEHENS